MGSNGVIKLINENEDKTRDKQKQKRDKRRIHNIIQIVRW